MEKVTFLMVTALTCGHCVQLKKSGEYDRIYNAVKKIPNVEVETLEFGGPTPPPNMQKYAKIISFAPGVPCFVKWWNENEFIFSPNNLPRKAEALVNWVKEKKPTSFPNINPLHRANQPKPVSTTNSNNQPKANVPLNLFGPTRTGNSDNSIGPELQNKQYQLIISGLEGVNGSATSISSVNAAELIAGLKKVDSEK